MNKSDKIEAITEFITSHPESTASRTILKRYLIDRERYETGAELGLGLRDVLHKKGTDEIDFCYYLVK
jgi:hypothetical protein